MSRFTINDDNKILLRTVHKLNEKEEYISLTDTISYFKDIAANLKDENDIELIHTIMKIFIRFKNRNSESTPH